MLKHESWEGKHGPLLIAEIGGNHEGDFCYAKDLTSFAIESGVDYVKFQIYTPESLVSRVESPQRYCHFQRFTLKPDQHIALAEMCLDAGVGYLASVWDLSALAWIDPYMTIYKIGSGDFTAYPVLREIAKFRKPLLVATGMSTLTEVSETVEFVRGLDPVYTLPQNLALLQCTSMYPISAEDAQLDSIRLLQQTTGLTIGYSDHTVGNMALEIAYAIGARILEFHFTDSREGKEFRDHQVSLTPVEVASLITRIGQIKTLRGTGEKMPRDCEKEHRESFRRAVYPIRDLPAGHRLSKDDLVCLRPNHGIDAREFDQVVGKVLRREAKALTRMESDMFN